MKYLIDTNVWLEIMLGRSHCVTARRMLESVDGRALAITDFSVYSIGIYVSRLRPETFLAFTDDLIQRQVAILSISPASMRTVMAHGLKWNLTFDDAVQHFTASRHALTLVSYDCDFDRTPQGRVSPEQVLESPGVA